MAGLCEQENVKKAFNRGLSPILLFVKGVDKLNLFEYNNAHQYFNRIQVKPISGRIPDELFNWLTALSIDSAVTMSDKLRLSIQAWKDQMERPANAAALLAQFQAQNLALSQSLVALEEKSAVHSEVLKCLLEHLPVMMAALQSATLESPNHAAALEQQLVRRLMLMVETLLRQATTRQAAAFDDQVIHQHINRVLELASIIEQQRQTSYS